MLAKADGTIVIWDMETSGVARKLRGHTRHVQSLRYLGTNQKAALLTDPMQLVPKQQISSQLIAGLEMCAVGSQGWY